MKILSIDAWREDSSWTWNNWFNVGTIEKSDFEKLDNNRKLIRFFRDSGFIGSESAGRVAIDDDMHNIVLIDKNTHEPLFAIEYGPEY